MNIDALIYLDTIRRYVKPLPAVTEKLCFGTPAFYVGNKLFARLKEGGEKLVIHTFERESLMKINPSTFFITEHYKNYSYMLVDLTSVTGNDLKKLLYQAWRNRAPAKMIKQSDL